MKVYYKTKTENQKKKTDGTYNDYSNAKKVNKRKRRKLKEHTQALEENTTFTETTKAKSMSVLTLDFMSTDESEDEHSFVSHPIPWMSTERLARVSPHAVSKSKVCVDMRPLEKVWRKELA
ncbi:uncharacterized protein LOC134187640 [Corticium candelabrum]|uniref:uncharacterized protein LOC134187640 n=1 Tax=Corticium candelabrum TaxID=121492 RepID=UPI002E26C68C|nr:uncharacterized protein LOC134187640 [Corticium candelabrum]